MGVSFFGIEKKLGFSFDKMSSKTML